LYLPLNICRTAALPRGTVGRFSSEAAAAAAAAAGITTGGGTGFAAAPASGL